MDTPSDASHPTEAMAAWQDRISRTSGTRGKSRRCVHGGGKLPSSVAKQWTGAECGSRYKLGRSTENPETLLTSTSRTPDADPLVRWCGRGEQVTAPLCRFGAEASLSIVSVRQPAWKQRAICDGFFLWQKSLESELLDVAYPPRKTNLFVYTDCCGR